MAIAASNASNTAPSTTPTPIAAFAPLDSPESLSEGGVADADVPPVVFVDVAVTFSVCVMTTVGLSTLYGRFGLVLVGLPSLATQ